MTPERHQAALDWLELTITQLEGLIAEIKDHGYSASPEEAELQAARDALEIMKGNPMIVWLIPKGQE